MRLYYIFAALKITSILIWRFVRLCQLCRIFNLLRLICLWQSYTIVYKIIICLVCTRTESSKPINQLYQMKMSKWKFFKQLSNIREKVDFSRSLICFQFLYFSIFLTNFLNYFATFLVILAFLVGSLNVIISTFLFGQCLAVVKYFYVTHIATMDK